MTKTYTPVAITLHWVLAILLMLMVFMGWYMEDLREQMLAGEAPLDQVQAVYNTHKTIGLIILAMSFLRLYWRLRHPGPGLPEGMTGWERLAAQGTHWAFYAIMIGMPIGGWLASSASPFPAFFFNDPALPIPKLPVPQSEELAGQLGSAHGAGAWAFLILVGLHIAAALKHQFINRDNLLARMIPFLKG